MPKRETGAAEETASTPSQSLPLVNGGQAVSTDLAQPNLSTLPNPFSAIVTNIDSTIPQYEKLEISFQLDTVATNLQFPFDANPPAGVDSAIGVTVDAEFTPDNWETIFIQPAFYYQSFLDEERDGQEWLYPTDEFEWQVRFSPNSTGEWQVRLRMEDANGRFQTDPIPFTVTSSENQGFIRVSERDTRYFEYDNGDYFQGMGVNLELPNNLDQLPIWGDNGVQLIRTYLPSQYSIWGAAWSPWRSVGASDLGQETNARLRHDGAPGIDGAGLEGAPIAVPGHDFFLWLSHDETVFEDGQQRRHFPCAVMGWNVPPIPAQPNTTYRVRVRYRLGEMIGSQVAGEPVGLTVKTAQWLWNRRDKTEQCTYPGTGNLVAASYESTSVPDPEFDGWMIMEGEIDSGNASFLPRLWLAIENATSGSAFIDQVWIEAADGPNVAYKSSMANHLYFDQRSSFAFDKGLTAAEAAGLALKLVVMEKGDYALNQFGDDGNLISTPLAQGTERPFYGNGRQLTKIRWLQQAYWRYLQARWGYSTAVHSWELLNEGSPTSEAHYILADEFGKYMQTAFVPAGQAAQNPNGHLITTSFWNGFPQPFWNSGDYPYVDYADVHHYARPELSRQFSNLYAPEDFYDAAQFSIKLSEALQERTPTMPVVRGEVGFLFAEENLFANNVTDGLWLHNLIWAGINAGGMMELYWTGAPTQEHIVGEAHDHRAMFRPFANFMADVPLSNGRYVNASPTTSTPQLRAWGQQDVEAGRAHLWIQNGENIWGNVARETAVTPISGSVVLTGFIPNEAYTATWWDTYQPDPAQQIVKTELISADSDGRLVLMVEGLVGDTAVKILK